MTFALGLALPLTSGAPTVSALLEELVEEVEAAEAAGFDLAFVPEHHQGPRVGYCAPLVVAAHLLARTSRIRVATGVLVLPAHHPLHVAETATMLDHLSDGRFVLGVGAGYQPADLAPFGVDLAERGPVMEEWLEVLRQLFNEPDVNHHGGRLDLDGVRLRPPPRTPGGPPVWLGSWSGAGVRRAARWAGGWVADPIRTVTEVAGMADAYRAAVEELGTTAGPVVVMREAWVDNDDDRAHGAFADLVTPVFGYYRKRGAFTEDVDSYEELAADRFVVGSPETVADTVVDVAARTGGDAVVLHLRHPGGPTHEVALERIAAVGKAVAARRANARQAGAS
ncbi:LLM class flavin-dependent oxidoreductase [Nocardioides halotolerans]|uniref:LLM class flavin-dependent oxidoreductase n=1 Tax=Nocardioides halotolerans TaxID=433660 RepID=UPI0009FF17E9|nr:LLM class flavin-dependent oxidoreductase [Nocardioides halotolerans]